MSRDTGKTWFNRGYTLGILLYPLLAHFSIYYHHSDIAVVYLLGLFAIYLLGLVQFHWSLRVVFVGLLAGAIIVVSRQYTLSFWLYLPPALIPLWVGSVFLASLRHPQGPVISRIAEMMEGEELSTTHRRYTQAVTLVWGVVLLAMGAEAILLAWLAPVVIWSWWVNIGNYIMLLVLLLLELPLRWIRLGKRPQLNKMLKAMLRRPWIARSGY